MDHNRVYIDNFHEQNITLGLGLANSNVSKTVITGLHPKLDHKIANRQVISEIFKALLLHDIVVISTPDLIKLVHAFGLEDTIALIKTKRLEFADDKGLTVAIGEDSQDKYIFADIFFATGEGDIPNSIQWLENKLTDSDTNNNQLLNILLLNAEKYNNVVDVNLLSKRIKAETQYDLNNTNVSNYLNINSTSTIDIRRIDIYNILRLGKLNKSLIFSALLNADNIAIDGAVKTILGAKLSPRLSSSASIDLYDSFFQEVFHKKDIPDLADLYINKVIDINEYLEIVSSITGSKFRNWIMDKEYDPIELEKDLFNLNPKISSKYSKFYRRIIPSAIGLINPAAGIATSLADSFILERLMSGWHPNFFLDDLLRQRIDNKISLHEKTERNAEIKRRFPNVGRNDPCPCGSKKKFKKCCGK